MDLEGQGERGYAMAALLVMIGVMAVMMTAVMPVWRHDAQREKEAELVFRGQQYVRAIRLYQAKFRTFPPSVDVLVQQRCLRRKYKDPITGDDFQPLYAGGAGGQPGGLVGPGQPSTPAGGVGQSVTPAGTPSMGGQPGGVVIGTGGIIGVTSKSKAESIRVYNGATHYNEWQFLFVNNGPGGAGRGVGPGEGTRPRPGGPGGRLPGGPGREGQPFPGGQGQPPITRPDGGGA